MGSTKNWLVAPSTYEYKSLTNTMETAVRTAMIGCSAPDRARRIGSAHRFISDTNFTNLLQNIDINAPKKFNYAMFSAFNGVPGLAEQVSTWIKNS